MILSEPGSQKEVFDERQKIMRSRLATEALLVYAAASVLLCMSVEFIYRWAESCCFLLIALGVICAVYYQIRCSAKGCLIGVNGLTAKNYSGWTMIFMSCFQIIRSVIEASDYESGEFFLREGMLTVNFFATLTFTAILIWGIIISVKISRLKKRGRTEEN